MRVKRHACSAALGNAVCHAAQASLSRRLSRNGGNADDEIRAAAASALSVAVDFPRLSVRLGRPTSDYANVPDRSFEFGFGPSWTAWQRVIHAHLSGMILTPPDSKPRDRQASIRRQPPAER